MEAEKKLRVVVVPSLRADVVGAKGFGVSRTYFAEGVKRGKVRVGGKIAMASTPVAAGDLLVAEGLGRLEVKEVLGTTTRGNFKVSLEVEKP